MSYHYRMDKTKLKTILKYSIYILIIIVASTVAVKLLTGGDTLSDYARKNPDKAYSGSSLDELLHREEIPEGKEKNDSEEKYDSGVEKALATVSPAPTPSPDVQAAVSPSAIPEASALPDSLEPKESITPVPSISSDSEADNAAETSESANMDIYADGFTSEPIPDNIKKKITGISYPADDSNIKVSMDELRYLRVLYYDFNSQVQIGEIICNEYISDDLLEIFAELFKNRYQIQSINLIDDYGGDDTLSMEHNNTSCFNYRVVPNSTSLSKHARGLAIDVNPFYNPYLVFGGNPDGTDYISPRGSEIYIDRSLDFEHKIDKNDLCYKLFHEHGFTWGGDWNSSKDYQHFQKVPN